MSVPRRQGQWPRPATGAVLWSYDGWQNIIPVPHAVDAGQNRVLIAGAYGAGSVMLEVEASPGGGYRATELFTNPDFASPTQPPVLYRGHFYSHYTI